MKDRGFGRGGSTFWSRLLGLMIVFAIIAVMVVGGVKNLMAELSTVHDALSATRQELALTKHHLAATQNQLADTQTALENETLALQQNERKLEYAGELVAALHNNLKLEQNRYGQLAERWKLTLRALEQRNDALIATDKRLRQTEAALEQMRQQPTLSMIVTSERQLQLSHRERFAASSARMYAEGANGRLYYEGARMQHEVEKQAAYAERTQVILTQIAPGHDALKCLADESLGCATVVAARSMTAAGRSYSYQAQFSEMEMLLADGRRGRRR